MSAKTRKFAAPRGMSRWLASETGFPVSATSACRKSSKRFSIPSATARWSTRRCAGPAHRRVDHRAVGFVNLRDHRAVDRIDLGELPPAADELAVDVALALGNLDV